MFLNLRFIHFLQSLRNFSLRLLYYTFEKVAQFALAFKIKNFGCAICACVLKIFICTPTSECSIVKQLAVFLGQVKRFSMQIGKNKKCFLLNLEKNLMKIRLDVLKKNAKAT